MAEVIGHQAGGLLDLAYIGRLRRHFYWYAVGCKDERGRFPFFRLNHFQGRLNLFSPRLNKERMGMPARTVIDLRCTAAKLGAGLCHASLITLPACFCLVWGENEAQGFPHAIGGHIVQSLSKKWARVAHPHVDR